MQHRMPDEGVVVYQKSSQCCRCCCCQPNVDWRIHNYKENWSHSDQLSMEMLIKEDAPYWGRCWSNCWPGFRRITYTVYDGDSENGQVLFKHEKAWTCSNSPLLMYTDRIPVRCPWCCCLPYLETKDANGTLLGTSKYVCYKFMFIPKFDLFDNKGNHIYRVQSETCCGGLCVRCRCFENSGQRCEPNGRGVMKAHGNCFRIPFLIRKPKEPFEPIGDAQITDVWAGAFHERCTKQEMYAIKFPVNMSPQDADALKKTLIGMTLLIDITINEQDH